MERLTSHRDFVAVLRRRRRISRSDIVVHYLVRDDCHCEGDVPARARRLGLAVSKSVGNAVTRNTVKRRFRVLARRYEDELPQGCDVVIRAKPTAATTPFQELERQIASAFRALASKTAVEGEHHQGGIAR